jgi:hypothetical protein
MNGYWRWIPGVSVGPFTFGELAEPYISDFDLQKRDPDCSIAYWENYELPGFESWITVENGRIVGVLCSDEVEYGNNDLIGMHSSDVRELLGTEDNKDEDVGVGYSLEYYALGLTLFVEEEVIKTAACGPVLDEEESATAH